MSKYGGISMQISCLVLGGRKQHMRDEHLKSWDGISRHLACMHVGRCSSLRGPVLSTHFFVQE